MKMNSKILAVAVVAMFAATAFAVLADSEDDDAANVTYHYYLQLNDDTSNAVPINKWLVSYDASAQTAANYLDGLCYALQKAELDYEFTGNWIVNIGGYESHGSWDNISDYYGFAVYYASGNEWKATSTYDEGTTFAIVFDKYLWQFEYEELSDKDKAKYLYNDWGYATKLPTVGTTSYDNTMMYIIIAVVVIIIIIAIIFFVMKKKKNA
jgi:hypothetical protein